MSKTDLPLSEVQLVYYRNYLNEAGLYYMGMVGLEERNAANKRVRAAMKANRKVRQAMGKKKLFGVLGLMMMCLAFSGGMAKNAWADTAIQINKNVDVTLDRFYREIKDGRKLVGEAKGVLIFPNVYKAGFGIGGEYGEGALRLGGRTVDYYSTAAGSFGFQLGAQKKSIILLFMQDEVLNHLRESSNWKAGAGASITVINVGADGSVDTAKLNEPIIAFVIGQKGLMYNLSLEGAKFTKLNKS